MFDTATLELRASRYTPFVHEIEFPVVLTGASFAMVVRDSKANGATARATLSTQTTDVEGVRLVSTDGTAGTSLVRIRINEATMEAMDVAEDQQQAGQDVAIYWDMHITPSGGDKFRAVAGDFVIVAGATQ